MGFLPVAPVLASIIEGISTFQIILFVVGLLLLIVEMFLPGFGIAGGSGVVLLVIAIVLTAKNATQAAVMVLILLALIALVLFVILRSAKKGKLSKTLILNSAARSTEGYRATADLSDLLGNVGVALTVLRPAGTGEFTDRRLDVVAEGMYIDKGTPIKIVRIEGRRIVVEPVEE
ncbi:MAG: hypothetical protein GX218_04665 [Clostridiaceae bacterium]|jgi:membrane-bound ClpP family serine protease|nr:hypothetical protein [Clostridiaceae bacterium]